MNAGHTNNIRKKGRRAMYNEWSLDILYKGLDDKKYKDDFDKLGRLIDELTASARDWPMVRMRRTFLFKP